MSRASPTFESRLVPLFLHYAKERGLDVAPLVRRFSLDTGALEDAPGKQYLTTPLSTPGALADELAKALNEPHLGLKVADAVPKGAYGVAEFLIRAVSTLREAFENTTRYNAILAPGQSFRFVEEGGEARLESWLTVQPGALGRHVDEYVVAKTVHTLRSLADVPVTRVFFTNPKPESTEALTAYFRTTRLDFEQPVCGFAVDAAALALPVKSGDAALFGFLEEHARAALASRPKTDDLVDKLRHAIREALKQGEPNVERLAARMSLSGRTLQRRLAELGTSFQDVLDQVRFDLARAWLSDARLDLSQVAYLLGYSELRAFDRAFRRWAGQSPGEWRSRG
ncbi:MAG: AraC family transcriptional regulator ligand-binding domain-containing protein [Myxococcota bacterium]